ncbi:Uncharacterized protein CTYZ_00003975 [Cryptosporidium tyzzeri]|nr:Uncharacterized protein CTYZ_00003975 [Cryptosporidium tyzzeri]
MFGGRRRVNGGAPAPLLSNTEQSTCQITSLVYVVTSIISLICLIVPVFLATTCSDHNTLWFVQVVLGLDFVFIFVFMYLGLLPNGTESEFSRYIGTGVVILVIQCIILAFGIFVFISLIYYLLSNGDECRSESILNITLTSINLLHSTITTFTSVKLLLKLFTSIATQYKTYDKIA